MSDQKLLECVIMVEATKKAQPVRLAVALEIIRDLLLSFAFKRRYFAPVYPSPESQSSKIKKMGKVIF